MDNNTATQTGQLLITGPFLFTDAKQTQQAIRESSRVAITIDS